jgi:hypothetical protein
MPSDNTMKKEEEEEEEEEEEGFTWKEAGVTYFCY